MKELKTYCYYCKDREAEVTRKVRMLQKNGYKLADFEAKLCKNCNYLSDEILTKYFSV